MPLELGEPSAIFCASTHIHLVYQPNHLRHVIDKNQAVNVQMLTSQELLIRLRGKLLRARLMT